MSVHPTAVIGEPAEHRDVIWAYERGEDVPQLYPSIHATAIVGALCTIDAGITKPTHIGAYSFLMKRCHVAHDVWIGERCELGAQVCVCGEVEIGDDVQIGGNTWIRPFVKIGDGARIGGGSVVLYDVPAGAVVAGNPAKPLRSGHEASSERPSTGQLRPTTPKERA